MSRRRGGSPTRLVNEARCLSLLKRIPVVHFSCTFLSVNVNNSASFVDRLVYTLSTMARWGPPAPSNTTRTVAGTDSTFQEI